MKGFRPYCPHVLERKGVTCVFELSGGMIAHLLDSLGKQKKFSGQMHHEQEPHLRPRRIWPDDRRSRCGSARLAAPGATQPP